MIANVIEHIRYVDNVDELPGKRIEGFCRGWKYPLSELKLRELLERSSYRLTAVDEPESRVVGIITALSDEVNWAFIPFLEVVHEYQGQGIGRQLVERMLDKLKHINCIDLTCDPEKQAFYEKFGMLKSHGMVVRRYLQPER